MTQDEQDLLEEQIDRVHDLRNSWFQVIELTEKADEEQDTACSANAKPSAMNPFIDPSPDQLLRASVGLEFSRGHLKHVYNILRGKDLVTGDVSDDRRVAQFARLAAAQEELVDLSARLVSYQSEHWG